MRVRLIACALALTAPACSHLCAATLSVELPTNVPVAATIDSKVDDSNYRDPLSYRRHGAATRHFVKQLTLTNTGATPLTGPLLIANGADWSSPDGLRTTLGSKADDLVHFTFKLNRRFFYSKRFYNIRWDLSKTGFKKFIYPISIFSTGQ